MRDPKQTILISLKNEAYDKLILEVDPHLTPEEMARSLREEVEKVLWEQQNERRRSEDYEKLVFAWDAPNWTITTQWYNAFAWPTRSS